MASRFPPGSTAYGKDGRSYTVETTADGTVYCTTDNGTEMEFPEATLMTAAEWAARADGRRDISYTRLRLSRHYAGTTEKIDLEAATQLLAKAERLFPSLMDFTAFMVASRILEENQDQDLIETLSIKKSRAIFDAAKADVRASLLATVLSTSAEMLISAVRLGDNLMRAMIDKGLAHHGDAYEEFGDRPRR